MTSPAQSREVPMPSRCECGHNEARHALPGFDGECVADRCKCKQFRPVEAALAAAALPVGRPVMASASMDQVVTIAASCGDKRTELVAQKIRAEVDELRARLKALRARALSEQIDGEIRTVPDLLRVRREARTEIESGLHGCRRPPCVRTFNSPQGRAMHERRAHDGFDPTAAHAAKAG